MRKPSLSAIIPLIAIATFAGCQRPEPPAKVVVRPIKTHRIGALEPQAVREYPGRIRAYQTAEMGFEVPGRVTEFLVNEGDPVEKDAPLAKLDARDYQAQLKVAQANLNKANADFNRSQNIFKEDPGAISADDIDRDRRAVEVNTAMLEIAQKAVADTELRAPFAGRIARKLVEDFANVQAKQSVMIVQDTSILEIEVAVPERDFVRRKVNGATKEQMTERLKPEVIVSALPDRRFPARIREYSAVADPVTRTFSVKLNFDRPDDVTILPGMTARVRVIVDPASAWSVPAAAARADDRHQAFVWRVDPDTLSVSRQSVALGPLTGDRVLLTEGVAEGDLVAISGVGALREGMKVRLLDSPASGDRSE